MNFNYNLRQLLKFILQSTLFPLIYNIYKKNSISNNIVIFADAHNNECPISMLLMNKEMKRLGYEVYDSYLDYQNSNFSEVFKNVLNFYKLFSKAKFVFICDNFLPIDSCLKKKETIVIQLWHAGGILKRFGYDVEANVSKIFNYNKLYKYDFVTVSSPICKKVYSRAMKLPINKIIATGTSRSDLYFDKLFLKESRQKFKKLYPDYESKKIILWTPTYRGNPINPHLLGLDSILNLQNFLGDDYVLIIKVHPHLEKKHSISNCCMKTEELLPYVDLLITDYSSVLFDFLLFEKPILLFVPDYEIYKADIGFYIDLETMGVPLIKNGDFLIKEINRDFNYEVLKNLKQQYMSLCDGNAIYRIKKLLEIEESVV